MRSVYNLPVVKHVPHDINCEDVCTLCYLGPAYGISSNTSNPGTDTILFAAPLWLLCKAYDKLKAPGEQQQQKDGAASTEQQQQEQGEGSSGAAAGGSSKSGQSIDALLAAEVADLKDKKKQRFKWHDTGIKGTVFVEFPEEAGAFVG